MEAVGLVLQVVGSLVTIWGLWDSKNDLFPEHRPVRRLTQRVAAAGRRACRRVKRWFGWQPPPVHGTAHAGTINVTATAHGVVTVARPGAQASVEDILTYVDRSLAQLAHEGRAASDRIDATAERVDDLGTQIGVLRESVGQDIRAAVGGHNGRGLTVAWVGVFVSMVGTVVGAG